LTVAAFTVRSGGYKPSIAAGWFVLFKNNMTNLHLSKYDNLPYNIQIVDYCNVNPQSEQHRHSWI